MLDDRREVARGVPEPRMQPFFSTDGLHPRNTVRRWREMVNERLVPAERILATTPRAERREELATRHGIRASADPTF